MWGGRGRWRGSGVRGRRRCWLPRGVRGGGSTRSWWGSTSGGSPLDSSCGWPSSWSVTGWGCGCPETDGPVDPTDPTHRALVMALGAIAQKEVSRSRHRTLAAMRAQTFERDRFQGRRPPYGYRLVDAGPHPNQAQAAWGKRLQRLDPEPVTAAHVRWMFARRLEGRSLAGIARELNERGVLCPSMDDPGRNRNRSGGMWSVPTVGAILANPRYTGREVWNRRQATDRTRRSTVVGECVVSKALTHPALVSEANFVAAQQVRAERPLATVCDVVITCSVGCCGAGTAGGGWTHTGCTGGPGTAAVTATAAQRRDPRTRPRTSTSART